MKLGVRIPLGNMPRSFLIFAIWPILWPPGGHLEIRLRAITPDLMAGSAPNFNHRYIYLVRIFYRMSAWASSQKVSTMAMAISYYIRLSLLSIFTPHGLRARIGSRPHDTVAV
jgi:hypothetical protein